VIRAMLDTNVLASGFLSERASPGQRLRLWTYRRFTLVTSDDILSELERTFRQPYFRHRLTEDRIAADLELLRREAEIVTATTAVSGVATHPEDDLVLATALSGGADYLVTGDAKLQALGAFRGVVILSPRAFLDRLAARDADPD
jgi:uncharacterized protein